MGEDKVIQWQPTDDTPIRVSLEMPSESLRKLMKWSARKKLTVKVPNTFCESSTHFLTYDEHSSNKGNDPIEVIKALAKQQKCSARAVLDKLAQGEELTLDYMTPLPFLNPNRSKLSHPVEVEAKIVKKQIQAVIDENKRKERKMKKIYLKKNK